jgi:hypothetical protein
LAYAKKLFWLYRTPKGQKVPRIHSYEAYAEARNVPLDDVLRAPDIGFYEEDGAKFNYVMDHFRDLSMCRAMGMNGPLAISHQEILAWTQLTGIRLTRLELAVLRDLDRVFLEGLHSEST